jgi:hypothetical protein
MGPVTAASAAATSDTHMNSASLSPRELAATVLAGLALLLLPASASAQAEPAPVGDAPQSLSVTGSGRPDVDLDLFRSKGAEPKGQVRRVQRVRRAQASTALFGTVKRTKTGRIAILLPR